MAGRERSDAGEWVLVLAARMRLALFSRVEGMAVGFGQATSAVVSIETIRYAAVQARSGLLVRWCDGW